MFTLAFLIAIYAYLILFLGLAGLLYKSVIIGLTVVFLILSGIVAVFSFRICYFFPSPPRSLFGHLGGVFRLFWKKKLTFLILIFLIIQALVNLIGVLGPELSFDALWYHLTLPKIYLADHRVHFIPGGLLYYSASPQLLEMLYVAALCLDGVVLAKLTHFLFGIGSTFVLYKLLRKFLPPNLSLLGCLIFYSQLVVGWLSTTAYTDLAVVFYQNLALLAFLLWWEGREDFWLRESALLFGLASSVKLIGIGAILAILIILLVNRVRLTKVINFIVFSFLPLLPWLLYAFLSAGNPIYPYLTDWFFKSQSIGLGPKEWLLTRHPVNLLKVVWQTVFTRGDILTPVVLIGLPIVFYKNKNLYTKVLHFFQKPPRMVARRNSSKVKLASNSSTVRGVRFCLTPRRCLNRKSAKLLFSRLRIPPGSVLGDEAGRKEADPSWKPPEPWVLGEDSLLYRFLIPYLVFNFLFWFLTPLNYNRFLLPLIPVFLAVLLIKLDKYWRKTLVWRTFVASVIVIALLNLGARSLANKKFIPFILGQQTEAEFMKKHLNFEAGNFYDLDGFLTKRVGKEKKALAMGIHNLFYLSFPFKEISFVQKGDVFDYLLVGRYVEKSRFEKFPLVYKNEQVGISLYRVKTSF